jgi:predicted nuclease with RNAse H fold
VHSTTIGIDLSAQPKRTAACILTWGDNSARITHLVVGADNRMLLELIAAHTPGKVTIDAPLGWPEAFVTAG